MVGAPGQLVHRTCFRCARCSAQLTLASYYQTERGQYCCETCPDEERPPAPPSPTLASAQHCQTDTDEESSSEEEEESEEECEPPQLPDTPAPTPSPTPPKPRTVFLSQTLVGASEEPPEQPPEKLQDKPSQQSPFSEVSPALFGGVGGSGHVREHSPDPAPYPRTAKSLRTDPPEILDTGQSKSQPHTPADTHRTASTDTPTTSSSIVARRLQMFREISSSKGDREKHEEEREKTSTPSITVTSETTGRDGKESLTSISTTTSTQPPTTEQNPFEEDEKEDDDKESERVGDSHEDLKDSDQVVSEAEHECDRKESEEETSHTEEGEPEKRHRLTSETEMREKETSESEKDQKEKDQVVEPSESQVVNSQSITSSDSHSEPKNEVVSSSLDHSSMDLTPRESHTKPGDSQEYPDDLNPFGSEDEEEEETREIPQPKKGASQGGTHATTPSKPTEDTKTHTTTTGPSKDSPGRRLIKANLNPFESDEEEEIVEDKNKDSPSAKKEAKKSLNPFWSDDEEEEEETRGRTDSTAKGTRVKPPRPPPPTLHRNR